MRATAFLAMAIVLAASAVGPTLPLAAASPPAKPGRVAHVAPAVRRALSTTSAPAVDAGEVVSTSAAELAPVDVRNRNTNATGKIRLYDDHGKLDGEQVRAFMLIADEEERLDVRVVQLALRASYHFKGAAISIVSATRAGARGKHGSGEALDFALEGVKAPVLAAYLRTLPRAGVGIYTHPKTQYVHLDVREHSYHWIDGSPPGVTWREQLLSDPKQAVRDASWSPRSDLPE